MANLTRYNTQQTGAMPLSEAVDRLFRDAFTWPRLFGNGFTPTSAIGLTSNLYETNESYIMQVALPGVKADGLQVSAHHNVLTLHGKAEVAAPDGAQSIWIGLGSGEFHEEVTLPGEVDAESAMAEYHDGILTLTLPKSEKSKVRTIKVSSGQAAQAIEGVKK